MSRRPISILFSVLFLMFISAPTIMTLVDDSIDISYFYASAEEEEKSNEKPKNLEVFLLDGTQKEELVMLSKRKMHLRYFTKSYPKPHLNLISPPPEGL